ncbi:MAG: hypothetical protein ACYDGM_05580 [Vulcanimicrobiaceae bacterium]
MMIIPAILAALIAVAPAPTAPPVIFHTVSSPLCNSLQSTILPVGYVSKINDTAFSAMARSTQKFLSNLFPGDDPTVADLDAALAGQPTTALTQEMGSTAGDDQLLYGPGQILDASRIDAVAQQIFQNLTLEDGYMKQSFKAYPPGTDPSVDTLRQRAQNLIDLQRALANRYEQFASTYLDNQGMARMTTNSQSQLALFKVYLRGLLLGDTSGLNGVAPGASDRAFKSVSDLARNGSAGQVVRELRAQEYAFAPALTSTFDQCRGTKFTVKTPAPRPTP